MNLHFVGYDLQPGDEYVALREKLTGNAGWWHQLESTWLVMTEQSAEDYEAELVQCIRPGDKLLVIDVTARAARWHGFDDAASRWIMDSP